MGERKHKAESGEKKAIQPQREEEQQVESEPQEALKRVSGERLMPHRAQLGKGFQVSSILNLQRTIGNQAVQRLLIKRTADVPEAQRIVELRPPGRGEASAFDRASELIDRMNEISTGIEYRLEGGRAISYAVTDEAALTHFDRQMQGYIDRAETVPMRLITGAGYVGGGPLTVDSLMHGYVDLDDMLASDNAGFQSNMLHLLAERFAVRRYERRIGMVSLADEWDRVHPIGLRAEAAFFRDFFSDPSIRFNRELEPVPSGRYTAVFRSRSEDYRIFLTLPGGRKETRPTNVSVRTADGRRMSADDFVAERAAAAVAAAAAPEAAAPEAAAH